MWRRTMDNTSLVLAAIGVVTSVLGAIVVLRRRGDVNFDGKVDETDLQIVKAEISKSKKKVSKKKVSKKKVVNKKIAKKKAIRNKKSDS
jgi:hypothetical protein